MPRECRSIGRRPVHFIWFNQHRVFYADATRPIHFHASYLTMKYITRCIDRIFTLFVFLAPVATAAAAKCIDWTMLWMRYVATFEVKWDKKAKRNWMHYENDNKKSHPINCMHKRVQIHARNTDRRFFTRIVSILLVPFALRITLKIYIICTRGDSFVRCFAYEMNIYAYFVTRLFYAYRLGSEQRMTATAPRTRSIFSKQTNGVRCIVAKIITCDALR